MSAQWSRWVLASEVNKMKTATSATNQENIKDYQNQTRFANFPIRNSFHWFCSILPLEQRKPGLSRIKFSHFFRGVINCPIPLFALQGERRPVGPTVLAVSHRSIKPRHTHSLTHSLTHWDIKGTYSQFRHDKSVRECKINYFHLWFILFYCGLLCDSFVL